MYLKIAFRRNAINLLLFNCCTDYVPPERNLMRLMFFYTDGVPMERNKFILINRYRDYVPPERNSMRFMIFYTDIVPLEQYNNNETTFYTDIFPLVRNTITQSHFLKRQSSETEYFAIPEELYLCKNLLRSSISVPEERYLLLVVYSSLS